MDLINGSIKKIYFKYLLAAFGSAMIVSIYSIVDTAVVGQYQGASGTAALAVVAPIWNIIYSLGLFMGVGGSILFSAIRGKKEEDQRDANQYFTLSFYGAIFFSVLSTLCIVLFEKQILTFFGASDDEILSLSLTYLKPIKFVLPLFLFNQYLAAYLRNDNDPLLATLAVLSGGIFNIVGDIIFTFTLDMGVFGAGLATSIGSGISFVLMLIHFFKKTNTLRIVRCKDVFSKLWKISQTGFSTFFVDAAMGILTVLFNRQIMKYLGADALAVYGPILTISTFVQCCAYSVGQASQPIISINYGANRSDRIKETLKYSLITVTVFALFWTVLSLSAPTLYIKVFMKATDNILKIGPSMIRIYSISYLLLPLNIFSTYYFQSILKSKTAFIVSIMRGLVLSGTLILVLPLIKPSLLWFAMPLTEFLTSVFVIWSIHKTLSKLPKVDNKTII